ncbi:AraC family transcriptional regulator [Paraburkholderia sp. MMS20-SJTR3]|uniref:AraC family transcriptional regulator n=1 Tax=Paraburkholderia sejongensis TaxID=2886946 RepID=A0ABS8JQS6_9BURK|nr:AraC family transcriptional regulator [Paraburkholderia sp. MMS20-SJTR3]MCC8392222.1 AraC family transcriptional regulator [Paraburkholderia sp. MMS20-SJTR3]
MLDIHNALAPDAFPHQDSLGCVANRLRKDLELNAGEFTVHRKCTQNDMPSVVATPASGRGFLLGVALQGGHRRRIFKGKRSSLYSFDQHAIYLRDFADDYRADLQSGFDFVLVELSRGFIANAHEQRESLGSASFDVKPGTRDPVLGHLAQVLAHTLDGGRETHPLFVEQLGLAIGTHLLDQYGHAPARTPKLPRRLSPRQHAQATEMLLATTQTPMSIEQIAGACGLSRAYFIRAFKHTTARTPYQWLLEQRIERARELLSGSQRPITEIAVTCGFSDQSHFTRVFSQMTGTPPAAWRRQAAG